MIRSFRNAWTKKVYEGECPKGFPADVLKTARRKLGMVEAAEELSDLAVPPGNKLHPLREDREGQHSIWINDKWRICFRWTSDGPEDVEITDYHD